MELIAIAVGTFDAIGGAWKDTKHEPFEWLKFLRSPVIGLGLGTFVSLSVYPLWVQVFAYGGMIRLIAEIYKQIRNGVGYVPGKFIDKVGNNE